MIRYFAESLLTQPQYSILYINTWYSYTSHSFLKYLYDSDTSWTIQLHCKVYGHLLFSSLGFPGGSAGKESAWNVGDLG